MKFSFSLLFLLFFAVGSSASAALPVIRTWTSQDGRKVEGELKSYNGKQVTLLIRGKSYSMPKTNLSEEDQVYLDNWREKEVERNRRPTGGIPSLELITRHAKTVDGYIFGSHHDKWIEGAAPKGLSQQQLRESLKVEVLEGTRTAKAYVPKNYNDDPSRTFGIYVHISPTNGTGLPGYNQTFDKHGLIGISPANAGNKTGIVRRISLALDCVATLKAQYRIDPERVYIGGLSGGGITAIEAQLLYPDVFKAAVSHARNVALESRPAGKPGTFFRSDVYFYSKAEKKKIAKQDNKWVFVSGPKDSNYKRIKDDVPYWVDYGFKVKFFDIPSMGHKNASKEVFVDIITWIER